MSSLRKKYQRLRYSDEFLRSLEENLRFSDPQSEIQQHLRQRCTRLTEVWKSCEILH